MAALSGGLIVRRTQIPIWVDASHSVLAGEPQTTVHYGPMCIQKRRLRRDMESNFSRSHSQSAEHRNTEPWSQRSRPARIGGLSGLFSSRGFVSRCQSYLAGLRRWSRPRAEGWREDLADGNPTWPA